MGSPLENGSGPVVDALGDPLIDLEPLDSRPMTILDRFRIESFEPLAEDGEAA